MRNRIFYSGKVFFSALFVITLGSSSSFEQKKQPPNIILIMADDLGYGELGCYGQKIIKTPNIDKLANNGMKFTQFYSGSPVCAPARCILLTGKHAGHAYIRGNDEWADRGDVWDFAKAVEDPALEGQRPLLVGTITIGTVLQENGYKTACIGKWGLGGPLTEGIPTKQGFDYFYGYNCQRQAHTYTPVHLWENEKKVMLDNYLVVPGTKLDSGCNPENTECYSRFDQLDYAPERMLQKSLDFISRNKENPFFLYFASPIPHMPLQAPKEYTDKYIGKVGEDKPYLGDRGYFPNKNPKATYAGMVDYLDFQVGQIIARLKEEGVYENSIIIFTSDNGPSYNGGTDSKYFNSGGPFSEVYGRGKGFTYEGGIRVPLIVSMPGVIKNGSVTDHVASFYDILPTLTDVAGIEALVETDGLSFINELTAKEIQARHNHLYWEFPAYGGQQAVRMGDWKGIRKQLFKDNLAMELYNLKDDPRETRNLVSEFPGIANEIADIMKKEHVTSSLPRFRIEILDGKE